MLSKIIFICIFSFFFLFAFYLSPLTTYANEWCQTNCAVWRDPLTGTTESDCPASTNYLGQCNQNNPANFCDTSNWKFYYNPSCSQINFPCSYSDWETSGCRGTANCTWSQTQCNVTDSCFVQPYLNPGICDASKYNGSNPNSACVISPTIYKTCCNADGTVDGNCNGGDYTGTCPSGTITVQCGFADKPSCGAAACATLAPSLSRTRNTAS